MEEQATTPIEDAATALNLENPQEAWALVQDNMPLLQEYGLNLFWAVVIFVLGRWIAQRLTKALGKALAKTDMEDTLERFLCNLAFTVLMAVVVIAAIGKLGVETTSVLAIFGAAGLAVGLALQGSLSNFAAGVLIVAFRPYKVGDFIEAGGEAGSVDEVQIFTTTLKSTDNKKIIVPNSQVMSGTITNYTALGTRRVDMVFGCGYGDDIDAAYRVLQSIIEADSRILQDPAPTIALNELADSSVNFIVRPWVNSSDYWAVYNSVTEQVKRKFDEAGLNIPFPQRDVHMYHHGDVVQN
jgi:small conductance mechanosensitive channel